MSALDWVRSKAVQTQIYELVVSAEEGAAAECEPGTYTVTRWHFSGSVPSRMVFQLRNELKSLIVTDTEIEVLHVGGQYRSDFNKCEYFRTTYEKKTGA